MSEALPDLPLPGDLVDRYRIIAEIAEGGMAAVYAVRREGAAGFEKYLAMKILLPHLALERRFVDMLLDEARIAAHLHHPNVVQVFDVVEHRGLPALVMEYLDGKSLAAVLARSAPPRDVLFAILARAADGLRAAHEATGSDGSSLGLVHRDVKPHNIHVGYDGQVKLVDFGIVAARGRWTKTKTGELKGTLGYLAPEQISRSQPVDARADIWALGVVAWESLAGRRLFQEPDEGAMLWAIINRTVPRLSEVVPGVSSDIEALLMRCLERDPRKRPASAAELSAAFGRAAGGAGADAIAAHVRQAFAEERANEEAIRVARFDAPATGRSGSDTSGGGTVRIVSTSSQRSRRAWVGLTLAAVAAVLLGAGAIRLRASRAHAKSVAAIDDSAVDDPQVAPASEAVRARVTVNVDPSVTLVLVNGERRDERPLIVDVAQGGSASLDLVGATGAIVRRTITAADEGTTLHIASAPPAPSAASPSRASPKRPTDAARARSGPLLGNPY